jgi:ABC-type transport system substrate-binding protein
MDTIRKMHDDATAEGVIVFDVGWPGNPDPVINLTNGFYSVKPNSVYHTPQLDALIAQALETADNTARAAILKQAYKLVDADLPFIPICLEVTSSSMKSGITFKQTMGGLNVSGPTNLIDLTVK